MDKVATLVVSLTNKFITQIMKKTIFKIALVMLTIFINSCEADDGIPGAIKSESKNIPSINNFSTNSSLVKSTINNSIILIMTSVEGPFDIVNEEIVPQIGSIVNISAVSLGSNNFAGSWSDVSEGYELVSKSYTTIRIRRISKAGSTIRYHYRFSNDSWKIATYRLNKMPSPPSCPTSEHTQMKIQRGRINTYNYNDSYIYKWKVVEPQNGRTYYEVGKYLQLRDIGSYDVTVLVSIDPSLNPTCTEVQRTQTFVIGPDELGR